MPKQDFDAFDVQVVDEIIYFIEQIGVGDRSPLAVVKAVLPPLRDTLGHVPHYIFRICLDHYSLQILERIRLEVQRLLKSPQAAV